MLITKFDEVCKIFTHLPSLFCSCKNDHFFMWSPFVRRHLSSTFYGHHGDLCVQLPYTAFLHVMRLSQSLLLTHSCLTRYALMTYFSGNLGITQSNDLLPKWQVNLKWDLNLGPKQQYSLLEFEISVSQTIQPPRLDQLPRLCKFIELALSIVCCKKKTRLHFIFCISLFY